MTVRVVAPALLALLLTACVSVPKGSTPVPEDIVVDAAARAREVERQAWLDAQPAWSFEGRVALRQGGKGGSGRIEWQQAGRDYDIRLSAPVTRQSWRLVGNSHNEAGRIEGIEGGTREGESAEQLLFDATGWEIPVNHLPDWVLGLVATDAEAAHDLRVDAEGRPRRIEQMGWVVEYQEWSPAQDGRPALPKRIEASRIDASQGEARVRLLIDRWTFPTP